MKNPVGRNPAQTLKTRTRPNLS